MFSSRAKFSPAPMPPLIHEHRGEHDHEQPQQDDQAPAAHVRVAVVPGPVHGLPGRCEDDEPPLASPPPAVDDAPPDCPADDCPELPPVDPADLPALFPADEPAPCPPEPPCCGLPPIPVFACTAICAFACLAISFCCFSRSALILS